MPFLPPITAAFGGQIGIVAEWRGHGAAKDSLVGAGASAAAAAPPLHLWTRLWWWWLHGAELYLCGL